MLKPFGLDRHAAPLLPAVEDLPLIEGRFPASNKRGFVPKLPEANGE